MQRCFSDGRPVAQPVSALWPPDLDAAVAHDRCCLGITQQRPAAVPWLWGCRQHTRFQMRCLAGILQCALDVPDGCAHLQGQNETVRWTSPRQHVNARGEAPCLVLLGGQAIIVAALAQGGVVDAALCGQVAGAHVTGARQAAGAALHVVQPRLPGVRLAGNCNSFQARQPHDLIWLSIISGINESSLQMPLMFLWNKRRISVATPSSMSSLVMLFMAACACAQKLSLGCALKAEKRLLDTARTTRPCLPRFFRWWVIMWRTCSGNHIIKRPVLSRGAAELGQGKPGTFSKPSVTTRKKQKTSAITYGGVSSRDVPPFTCWPPICSPSRLAGWWCRGAGR